MTFFVSAPYSNENEYEKDMLLFKYKTNKS